MYRQSRVFICAFRAIWVNQLVALPTYTYITEDTITVISVNFMNLMLRYDQTTVTIIFVGFKERTSLLKVSWPSFKGVKDVIVKTNGIL